MRSAKAVEPRSGPKALVDRLAELRRREVRIFLRVNESEATQLAALSGVWSASRSSVLRMLIKRAYAEHVDGPLRTRAEGEIATEARRLAVNERVEQLKDEILEGVRDKRAAARTRRKERR